ncbi:MAG: hypothetical protein HOV83_20740 [Catenulispora sp.]|nr:hypothetical protein [Catenulispora sp.]
MRIRGRRAATAVIATGIAAFLSVDPAWAYAYESSNQYASYSTGGYTIYNDEWGSGHGTQTLWVNSATNWGVFSTQPSTSGVKSYANESKNIGRQLNSLSKVTSSFRQTIPSSGSFETAYDVWLNGTGIEVMVWTSTHGGVAPLGSNTGNVTLDGNTWAVYVGNNGSNPTYSFKRTSNEDSGSVNLLNLLKWLQNSRHYYNNPTLSQVQYGFEISGTGNRQQTFAITGYSVSVS